MRSGERAHRARICPELAVLGLKEEKEMKCPNCNSENLTLKVRGAGDVATASQVALICADCGRWIKWCPKKERHIYIAKSRDRLGEFKRLCEPLVKWLYKTDYPYGRIIITVDSAELLSGEMATQYPDPAVSDDSESKKPEARLTKEQLIFSECEYHFEDDYWKCRKCEARQFCKDFFAKSAPENSAEFWEGGNEKV